MSETTKQRLTDRVLHRRNSDMYTEEKSPPLAEIIELIYEDLQNIQQLQVSQSQAHQEQIAKLASVEIKLDSVEEMLSAWKNVKGFIFTIHVMGKIILWISAVCLPIAGFIYWIRNK